YRQEVTMNDNKHSRRAFLSTSAGALAAAPFAVSAQEAQSRLDGVRPYSRPSDLQITDLKVGYIRGGSHLFVKIFTNQDIVGHGEGADAVRGTAQLVMGW